MSTYSLRKSIRAAYARLYNIAPNPHLVDECFRVAHKGERTHRRMTRGVYKLSAKDAAKYFVLKWTAVPIAMPETFGSLVSTRQDCLLGAAINERLSAEQYKRAFPGPVEEWAACDYAKDIASP